MSRITGLAMSRQDAGVEFLLDRLSSEPKTVADQIAHALETYQSSEAVRDRVAKAMSERLL